jgi:hypothetical protein
MILQSAAGEHQAGGSARNHSLKLQPAPADPAANQQHERMHWLYPSSAPRKMYTDVIEPPPTPLILLFYQAEIRLTQFFHRKSLIR